MSKRPISGTYTGTVDDETGDTHYDLSPHEVPVPPASEPTPAPPFPGLEALIARLESDGRRVCDVDPYTTSEIHPWYYNGFGTAQWLAEHYHGTGTTYLNGVEVADYWQSIADRIEATYLRDYVRSVGCSARRVFAEGSERAYRRTGDLTYAGDVLIFCNRVGYAKQLPAAIAASNLNTGLADAWRSRPNALLLRALLAAKRMRINEGAIPGLVEWCGVDQDHNGLYPEGSANRIAQDTKHLQPPERRLFVGEPTVHNLDERIAICAANALDHIDQWFHAENAILMQPFMVGITCHALTEWADTEGTGLATTTAAAALNTAAVWLWQNARMPAEPRHDGVTTFYEYSTHPYDSAGTELKPAPTLNALIAPIFAALYRYTGTNAWTDLLEETMQAPAVCDLPNGKQLMQQFYALRSEIDAWEETN